VLSYDRLEHGLVAEPSLRSLRTELPDEIVVEHDRSRLRAHAWESRGSSGAAITAHVPPLELGDLPHRSA
jgi:hypothetical protein